MKEYWFFIKNQYYC